jgi:hypothetical protein
MGVPSGCQNVVHIMCWMVRALPSASLTLTFGRGWYSVGGSCASLGCFGLAFLARLHVDAVEALAVGGVGEPHGQLARVVLRLGHALGERLVPRLGLDHGELGVAVLEHVVGPERVPAPAVAQDSPRRDDDLAPHAAALDHGPARCLEGGIDVLGSGLGLVHGFFTSPPRRRRGSFFTALSS